MAAQDTGAWAEATATGAGASATQAMDIRFTGSGSEYFRIWLVNLLLTGVTLTFYAPFARARQLRYFHGNTWVGGHALGFHGNPWAMWRGHAAVVLCVLAYLVASAFSPPVAALLVLVFAGLWPALWHASLRYRLGNTSWRGLLLRFEGSRAEAYRAALPAVVPLALLTALGAAGEAGPDGVDSALPRWWAVSLVLTALVSTLWLMLGWPWLLTRVKRYQHGGYALAGERTACTLRARTVYGLVMRTTLTVLGVFIGGAVATALLLGALFGGASALKGVGLRGVLETLGVLGTLAAPAVFILVVALVWAWARARTLAGLQNLLWEATASPRVRFHSRLDTGELTQCLLRNSLLMLCTAGLYRPFAVVRLYRLRVEAVQLQVAGDVERWSQPVATAASGAVGDAAADLLGVDVGL